MPNAVFPQKHKFKLFMVKLFMGVFGNCECEAPATGEPRVAGAARVALSPRNRGGG